MIAYSWYRYLSLLWLNQYWVVLNLHSLLFQDILNALYKYLPFLRLISSDFSSLLSSEFSKGFFTDKNIKKKDDKDLKIIISSRCTWRSSCTIDPSIRTIKSSKRVWQQIFLFHRLRPIKRKKTENKEEKVEKVLSKQVGGKW